MKSLRLGGLLFFYILLVIDRCIYSTPNKEKEEEEIHGVFVFMQISFDKQSIEYP
jgi:hypothetical protein